MFVFLENSLENGKEWEFVSGLGMVLVLLLFSFMI